MKKSRSVGFTLLEATIVLAIVGILIAVAFPGLSSFSSRFQLRGAAREVATDLQYARMLAIKENRDFRVSFTGQSYQVSRLSDGTVTKDRDFQGDYPNVTLTSGAITFHSRGNASANTIVVSSSSGSRNVTVALNGRVRIE